MWNLFKQTKRNKIVSPVKGKVIDLSLVNDNAFASKAMGEGFAIEPTGNTFLSPISGTVTVVFPTGHALGIVNDDIELIIHIGIDTVKLQGDGFHIFVQQGDTIHQGDRIAEVNIKKIKEKGFDVTTMVVCTNGHVPKVMKKWNQDIKEGEEIAIID